jgi:uncharacterized protein YkwD
MRTLPTTQRRTATTLLVATLLVTLMVPVAAQAAPPHQASEQRFLELMNASRKAHGHPALAASADVATVARDWSKRMAADGRLRHNPNVSRELTVDWRRWGENVGWASNRAGQPLDAVVRRLHRSFMESDGHRANIMGDYNQVGVGVAVDDEGTMWATMVFVRGQASDRPAERKPERSPARLSDIDRSAHRGAITTAWRRDLIRPCEGRRYCPRRAVRRGELASVVSRMRELPRSSTDHFDDVTTAAAAINALADAGIVVGCETRRFCPERKVTRAQLASMLVRALPALRPIAGRRFTDLPPGYVHTAAINALAEAGVTRGCAARLYCPTARVTREQLASFLIRALDG